MRWKLAAAVAALVVASACVPPAPKSLSHDFAVTSLHPGIGEFGPPSTTFEGTVTNTGVSPADYAVTLVGSSGQTGTYAALDVLVGQTAVWTVSLLGSDVALSQTGVTSSPKIVDPVSAVASITRENPNTRWFLSVYGTLTNTGSSVGDFAVEIQADSGGVSIASAHEVQPGQTTQWFTMLFGQGTARILRTTTVHPFP
jgi:hypothetical protein